MRVIVSPEAAQELSSAAQCLRGEAGAAAATKPLDRFEEVVARLASGLVRGRSVVLRDGRDVRVWPMHPYGVYYRDEEGVPEIVRVYHKARFPIEEAPDVG